MKFTCDRDTLLDPLAIVADATGQDVLSHVLMRLDPGGLMFQGQDGEKAVTVSFAPDVVDDEGECLAPPTLLAALRIAPPGEVNVCLNGKAIHVETAGTSGNDGYKFPTAKLSDYPEVAIDDSEPTLEVAAGDLVHALRLTLFAAAREDGKYATKGVKWEVRERHDPEIAVRVLQLIATDGKRMSVADIFGTECDDPPDTPVIVPTASLSLLTNLLTDPANVVAVRMSSQSITFTSPKGTVYSRLLEGRFPPWQEAVPKKEKSCATFQAGALLHTVRQAAVVTDEESKRIDCEFKGGKLSITARGAHKGTAGVGMALQEYKGPPVTISFDPAHLIEFLKVLPSDLMIKLGLTGGDKSAVFRGEGWLHLVVPLV